MHLHARPHRAPWMIALLAALLVPSLVAVAAPAATPAPAPQKETKWLFVYDAALQAARKENKVVLAYFSASDADPWCQKLDKDVLNTAMFQEWAAQNIILLRIDFPKEKRISATIKAQNDRLKQKYSIIKSPTFVFLDAWGMPYTRAGWDEAKLRDDEAKGEPKAWIKYLEETIKAKPPEEELVRQRSLTDCLNYATKHYISALVLITQGSAVDVMRKKDELLKNQVFVKFVNRNLAFTEVEWPLDGDTSKKANEVREFIDVQKLTPTPMQLVVWDMQRKKVVARVFAADPDHADPVIDKIQAALPKIDYVGGWIDDYRQAQAIAQQQKRYVLLAFTSDAGEYSKKLDDEIFKAEEFVSYARKHMVTMRVDFPTAATQPALLSKQNKMLAEMFAIRGFPTVIVLNDQMKKVAEAKYMKGGPTEFLKELDTAINDDQVKRRYLVEH